VETLWPTPGCDQRASDLTENRRKLAELLNQFVGSVGPMEAEYQMRFVQGDLTYDEMVSYVRLCRYKIAMATAD
jgi:hypothetical protein